MNLDVEKIQLIDFSSEDDFLIDSDFDNTFVDLRLSVSFDTQKELVCNSKSKVYRGTKDKVPIFAEKERRTLRLEKENGDKECNSRKSLAWDHAFLTSPGFLELEELCLVNSGFKNLEVSSSLGNEDNVKSKVCQERKLSQKLGVGSAGKQKCQSLMKTKVASPSKMVSTEGSIRQQMAVGRSETTSRSAVAKSQSNIISRKEPLKSAGIRSQTRVSKVHDKKPPLRAISRNGHGMLAPKLPDLRSSNSIISSQSLLPSYATNRSIDYSPSKTSMDNLQTASLLESQEMPDGSITYDIKASQTMNLVAHQNNHQLHSCTKRSLGLDASKQNDTTEAKRSPFSSKASSLRMPSQKIGFFDMKFHKPEIKRHDQDGMSNNKGQRKKDEASTKKQTHSLGFEEKENIFHPEDTVIELELKKGSPSASQLAANGSSPSSGQCSSTSKKSHTKVQRPARQSLFSPTPRTKTSTSIPKVSPLKKSAFF
uniref:Uncharacterized protein n=2 Tax=Chenopodium quinoa TaxID=63459 RepID=A0A803NC32_CHEQI